MSKKTDTNPLFEGQREKSGSVTFDKYSFQYHWALYRVISNHSDQQEYAVIIELHEDVVVSNSLDVDTAKFEFNQVKTNKSTFNTHQLVVIKKGGNSVLGKLIKGVSSKPYATKIETLNLVISNKFSLELAKENVELKIIRKDDLSSKQISELESELKKEIGISVLPANLRFIISDIPDSDYQTILIGTIAKLINSLFPGSYTNAESIYTLLIDELYRKGKVTYDFAKWDELLKNKALTSIQVSKVINEFTNIKDEAKIEIEFNSICSEMGLKSLQAKRLRRSFDRYKRQRISNTSTIQKDTTEFFTTNIEKAINEGVNEMTVLVEKIFNSAPNKIKKQFPTMDDFSTALICEYIMMN
jgi:hypothetical protein